MADLLLLGEIPGTSIVITFWGWLAATAAVLAAVLLVSFLRSNTVANRVLYLSIARSKRAYLKHLDQIAL
jgi:hypothetical protein